MSERLTFAYGDDEIAYLSRKDKRLAAAIERIGRIDRGVTPDLFAALASSIVAQQISSKAADTVWGRLVGHVGTDPAHLAAAPVEEIQSCGLSMRKAGYIKGIAEAVVSGELNLEAVAQLSDDEVVSALSQWPGIGRWTAEMMLIFSLQRPDVLAWDDLAIRRGIMRLYGHRELTRERFERYRRRYSPYATVASLYLWELSVE